MSHTYAYANMSDSFCFNSLIDQNYFDNVLWKKVSDMNIKKKIEKVLEQKSSKNRLVPAFIYTECV